jgi:hypothetical protein
MDAAEYKPVVLGLIFLRRCRHVIMLDFNF